MFYMSLWKVEIHEKLWVTIFFILIFRLTFSLYYSWTGFITLMENGRNFFFFYWDYFIPILVLVSCQTCHLKSTTLLRLLGFNKLVKLSPKYCSCSRLEKCDKTCIIESLLAFVFNSICLWNLAFLKKR